MGRLTQWAVIEADIAVRGMSHDQKVRLADEIYAQQPTMLASILALGVLLISVQEVTVRACPDREDWRGVYFDGARKCLSRLEFLLVL
jgi:hypothetical protein